MMAKWSVFLIVFGMLVFVSCSKTDYTYNQDVAPILIENCVPCHRAQGAAPFSLTNYQQVHRKRNTIVKVTQKGYMPPWPANRHYSSFIGEKFLTAQQKAIIKDWVKGGAPEGQGSMPEIPEFSPYSRIGQPDTTLWFDSVLVPGTNRDQFYIMTLPFELEEKTFVRAMEFIPNENKLVHHMNGHLLNYEDGAKTNVYGGLRRMNIETDEQTYLANFDSLSLYNDDGSKPARIHSAVNYLPGVEASIYPEGIGGFTVNKTAILVANDMHYAPIPQAKWDYSHVNLFFAKTPPKRPVQETMMGTNGISQIKPALVIPANRISKHVSSLLVSQDISVLTINPHMHLLGQSFKAYAIDPSQDTIRLIDISTLGFQVAVFLYVSNYVKDSSRQYHLCRSELL